MLVELNLGHNRHVVSSSKGSALVAMTAFWVWHLFLISALFLFSVKRVLTESRVVLHQLKTLRGVTLILSCGVIILVVLGANHPDNLSGFAFLCHFVLLFAAEAANSRRTAFGLCTSRPARVKRAGSVSLGIT